MANVERSFKSKDKKQEAAPKIKYENLPRLSNDRALEAHARAMDRGADCPRCPLFGLRAGPVMGEIVPNARLVVIAEAPGETEVKLGRPMIGKSGQECDATLLDAGISRDECTITNTCLCRPPEEFKAFEYRLKIMHEAACAKAELEGRELPPPPATPSQCCAPRLKRDIDESTSKTVLALGTAALKAVADHWDVAQGSARKVKPGEVRIGSLKKQLGSPVTMPDGTIVVATYHPAFAMRKGSRHYKHVIRGHITRAAEIARRGHIDWKEPDYILDPRVNQVEEVLGYILRSGAPVTVDIETDKGTRVDGGFDPFTCRIRCIGFGTTIDGNEIVIVVPIRKINGDEWWSTLDEKKRVLQACMNVLNSNPLIGHNLAFDTGVLLRFKLIQNRGITWDDSMLAHHDTPDCDLPHDLGFVASRYFEVPSWKAMADDKFYDDVSDAVLHLYNARDVLTTMRVMEKLLDEVYRHGTFDQYAMDRALAPVCRDMGELGLFPDETKRGEYSLKANNEVYARLQTLKALVNDVNFNPNSPPQIRKFLFGTKKHTPMINTKGRDWEDGEDPSTNTNALVKMTLQQGCDRQTKDFINTLLEMRAYSKLKGTYIDNLKVEYPDWKNKYGFDVGRVPAVRAPIYREFKQKDKKDIALERWPLEAAYYLETKNKNGLKSLLKRVEEGVWEDNEVLPARSAMSWLHITYKLHIVPSGRLSSTPNAQNIPDRGKLNMRDMYRAPPGHVFVGADLDQIELRLYAAFSGDKILNEAFKGSRNGKPIDPHSLNAASMFAKQFGMDLWATYDLIVAMPKDQMKKLRGYAKTFAYLECYGGEADKLFAYMSTARDKATGALMFPDLLESDVQEWHVEWHRSHPETKRFQKTCEDAARLHGYTAAPIGSYRKRFFPGGPNKPGATFNHVIQGAAAEVANAALLRIAEKIPYGCWSPFTGLCLQVHDYIGVYVPIAYAEQAKKIIEEALNTTVSGIAVTASAKVSEWWSEQ